MLPRSFFPAGYIPVGYGGSGGVDLGAPGDGGGRKAYFGGGFFAAGFFPGPYYTDPAAVAPPGPEPWTGEFSDEGITDYHLSMLDTDLYVSWTVDEAINPPGTIYQIYVNNQLRWSDARTHAVIPGFHAAGSDVTIAIGKVYEANRDVDYSAALPLPPGTGNRAHLEWLGGRWIDRDLSHYEIFMSSAPGQPADFGRPVARVPAVAKGDWVDGFGRGPFGRGPFGRGVMAYEWVSGPLRPGSWEFAVAPRDAAGSLAPDPPRITLQVAGPPGPPATINGRSIWVESYTVATRSARITWNPSS